MGYVIRIKNDPVDVPHNPRPLCLRHKTHPLFGLSSGKTAIRPTSKRPLYKSHPGKSCGAQGNEAKLSSTSTPTQKIDKKHSLDALSDGMVSCDLPSWPQMLARREYHTLIHHMPCGHIKHNG